MAYTRKSPKIYESPDGGYTIKARDIGDHVSIQVTTNDEDLDHYPGWQLEKQTRVFNNHIARLQLIKKYPDLKEAWDKFIQLEKEYKAWDLLHRK